MNIYMTIIIVFNMTYDEYKSSKENKNKKNYIKSFLNKLFTIIIFTMSVVIISNLSYDFRSFIINNVLDSSLDFSWFNKLVNSTTNVFKDNKTVEVFNEIDTDNTEDYLDGVKYNLKETEKVYLKDSGIVTYIGEKEGYNNTIIVQQSNGYYAWYGNVKESVKLYDFVEKGSVIGSANNEYYYVLYKDDKPIKNED